MLTALRIGGFYQDEVGSIECKECVSGTFVDPSRLPGTSATKCHVCPEGTKTRQPAGHKACSCLDGYYRLQRFGGCYRCADDAGEECIDDYLSVKPGYWWRWSTFGSQNETEEETKYVNFTESLNETHYLQTTVNFTAALPTIYRCPLEESCNGSNGSRRIKDDNMCSKGYKGVLCGECDYYYYSWFQKCLPCPQKWRTGLQLFGISLLVILLGTILYAMDKLRYTENGETLVDQMSSILKIIVGFVQVMSAVFEAFSFIPWPSALLSVGHVLKVIELNLLAVATPICLSEKFRINALILPLFEISCQLFILLILWTYFGIKRKILLRSRRSLTEVEGKLSQTRTSCFRNSWWILFISYPSTAASIMAVFPNKKLTCIEICLRNCNDTDEGYKSWFLKQDLSVECSYQKSKELWILCWTLLAYVLLLPCLLLVALKIKQRAGNLGDGTTRNDFFRSLTFLDNNYKKRFWFWEVVEIGRKFALIIGIGFFGKFSHSGLALAILLAALFLVLHTQLKPISQSFGHWLQLMSLSVIATNVTMGALFLINYQDSRDPGYSNIIDESVFYVIVMTINFIFLLVVAGKTNFAYKGEDYYKLHFQEV